MLSNLIVVAGQVGTLFLLMAVGFFLTRRGHLTEKTVSQLSYILLYIVAPCVMIDAMQIPLDWAVLQLIGIAIALSLIYYLVSWVLIHGFWRHREANRRDTLRASAVFPNCGFMGIPLAMAVFGEAGSLYFIPALVVFNASIWTLGVQMLGGRGQVSVKKAICNPGIIGVILAITLYLLPVSLPSPAAAAVHYLGSLNTPLAMLVIGAQMARTDFSATFRRGELYLMSLLKLLIFPGIFAAALLPFHLPKDLYGVLVLMTACPVAGTTSIFTERYERDTATAAQGVTLSTLLSLITLPVIAAFLKA